VKYPINIRVNGESHQLEVEAGRPLLDVLREDLKLRGAKRGCETSFCGNCSVVVDKKIVHSCSLLAVDADGRDIETIEGLATGEELHPIQQAFIDHGGFQCGYCTPGMILSTKALLSENPRPSESEIREALEGVICRCTGYAMIIRSVQAASEAT